MTALRPSTHASRSPALQRRKPLSYLQPAPSLKRFNHLDDHTTFESVVSQAPGTTPEASHLPRLVPSVESKFTSLAKVVPLRTRCCSSRWFPTARVTARH